jgi:hypothetical protein
MNNDLFVLLVGGSFFLAVGLVAFGAINLGLRVMDWYSDRQDAINAAVARHPATQAKHMRSNVYLVDTATPRTQIQVGE